jgi:hypothetical protein
MIIGPSIPVINIKNTKWVSNDLSVAEDCKGNNNTNAGTTEEKKKIVKRPNKRASSIGQKRTAEIGQGQMSGILRA